MRATTTTTLDRARARGRGPSRARARAARRAGAARRRMAARPAPASGSASRRRPARRARCREHRQVVRLGRRDHEGRRPRCCGIAAPPSGSGTTRCGSPGGLPRRGDPWRRLPGRRGRHRRRGIPCRGAVAALAPPRRGPGAPHAERLGQRGERGAGGVAAAAANLLDPLRPRFVSEALERRRAAGLVRRHGNNTLSAFKLRRDLGRCFTADGRAGRLPHRGRHHARRRRSGRAARSDPGAPRRGRRARPAPRPCAGRSPDRLSGPSRRGENQSGRSRAT